MKHFILFLMGVITPLCAKSAVNDVFTAKTSEGLEMTFTVTSEGNIKSVRTGANYSHCIDWDYKGDVTVPSSVIYNGITYIVTEIGNYSFSSCAMKSITLPATINTIRSHGISFCHYLKSIHIPASVTIIEEGAICQNSITSLTIDAANKNYVVVNKALYNKEKTLILQYTNNDTATSFSIPSTVMRIADYAFDDCDYLVSVTIPSSVQEIGKWAFHQCEKLASLYIPASVVKIEEGAFTGYNKAMTSLKVDPANPVYTSVNGVIYTKDMATIIAYPVANSQNEYAIIDGTTDIYGASFSSAENLYSILIPNSVVEIGNSAFFGCDGLKSVDIPESVQKIGSQAFDYCRNLTKVYFHSPTPPKTTGSSVFGGNADLVLFVPYTGLAAYRNSNLMKIHIDPAIDWHDDHWFFVFCCVEGINFSQSEGIKAYKVVMNPNYNGATSPEMSLVTNRRASSNSPVMLVPVDKVGPGDCVLLQAEPGMTYELHSDASAQNITDNLLNGAISDTSVSSTDGDKTNFVFNGSEFVPVVGLEEVSLGTGYLQIPTADVPEGLKSITPTEMGAATNINAVRSNKHQSVYYSLQGVKIPPTHKGIYIFDGKKQIIR